MGDNLKITMKYIVYCTRNNKNSKIYIGVHGTENPNKFDGYLGCGIYTNQKIYKPKTAFHKAVKKYKPGNFTRITLSIFNTEDEAYRMEELIVNSDFVKRRDTYNMVTGGKNNGAESSKLPVAQYSADGSLVKVFESRKDAADHMSVDTTTISGAVLGKQKTCRGYIWRNAGNTVPDTIEVPPISIEVVQYSKAGYRMKTWKSATEAAKSLNCDRSTITAICKGQPNRKSIGGFQWRYADDNLSAVPAMRGEVEDMI
jgi:hypothetical protein